MKNAGENLPPAPPSRALSAAIRDVKNALADRDDVVVDMREAHRMRLDLLAADWRPSLPRCPQRSTISISPFPPACSRACG